MQTIFTKLTRYFGHWLVAVLDPNKGIWQREPMENTIDYLKAMNAHGNHILMKPSGQQEPFYLVCDDLKMGDLVRDHQHNGTWKPGRLVVETSPANYQLWIRSDRELSLAQKHYWLCRMGSDPGCSPKGRWGRCPGFRNRKRKYSRNGLYPLSRLIWIDWTQAAPIPAVSLI